MLNKNINLMKKSCSEISNLRKDSKKSEFILGGDFNVPDISWKDNTITSSKNYPRRVSQTHLDIASDRGLEQMVSFPTRGDNTLDLNFTSHPSYQERCKPLSPLSAKSDHDIVMFETAHQTVRARPKRRTIYLWKKADTDGIGSLLQPTVNGFSTHPSPLSTVCGKILRGLLTKQLLIMFQLSVLLPDTHILGYIPGFGVLQDERTELTTRQDKPRILSTWTDIKIEDTDTERHKIST